MRHLLTVFSSLLCTIALAQTGFDHLKHDFGTIETGDQRFTDFTFTNNSTETVFILRFQKEREIYVRHSTQKVEPDSSALVRIQYNPTRKGSFNVKIPVYLSNSMEATVLEVKGVIGSLDANPLTACPDFTTPASPVIPEIDLIVEVVDVNTREPIRKATVELYSSGYSEKVRGTDNNGQIKRTVPIGLYRVKAQAENYEPGKELFYLGMKERKVVVALTPMPEPVAALPPTPKFSSGGTVLPEPSSPAAMREPELPVEEVIAAPAPVVPAPIVEEAIVVVAPIPTQREPVEVAPIETVPPLPTQPIAERVIEEEIAVVAPIPTQPEPAVVETIETAPSAPAIAEPAIEEEIDIFSSIPSHPQAPIMEEEIVAAPPAPQVVEVPAEPVEPAIVVTSKTLPEDQYVPNNVVFLIDVSASMRALGKLDLLKLAIIRMSEQLRPIDRLSIVTYSSNTNVLLQPTAANEVDKIEEILLPLEAMGRTAGGKGIIRAFEVLNSSYIEGGNNQILMATDGAFNIQTDDKAFIRVVKKNAREGRKISIVGVKNKDFTIESMKEISTKGLGHYVHIETEADTETKLLDEVKLSSKRVR